MTARRLEYLSPDAHVQSNEQLAEVRRKLYRFMQSLGSGPDS
jgi:hypothetical protein